jgi:nitrite reductase/ring-hydroxylating ferredoxin subunit
MKQVTSDLKDELAEGEVRAVPVFGSEVRARRTGDRIRAAANVCLHPGGSLECNDGAFVCPSHGARFDIADGRRIDGAGPANARLMMLSALRESTDLPFVWGEPA